MGSNCDSQKVERNQLTEDFTIALEKTCYLQGDFINGSISVKGLKGNIQTKFTNPIGKVALKEFQKSLSEDKEIQNDERVMTLIPLYYSNCEEVNQMTNFDFTFSLQVPKNTHPTCIFGSDSFIRHVVIVEISAIKLQKSGIVVIKNGQYFTKENGLFSSPIEVSKELDKEKLLSKGKGRVIASLKLPKNSFAYNERIPFEVNIDSMNLKIKIKSVVVGLYRIERKNDKKDIKKANEVRVMPLVLKTLLVDPGKPRYFIENYLELPTNSPYMSVYPPKVYEMLEEGEGKNFSKFNNIHLAPSCYEGLLSVYYYIKMHIEYHDEKFPESRESLKIVVEFFEPQSITGQNANEPVLTFSIYDKSPQAKIEEIEPSYPPPNQSLSEKLIGSQRISLRPSIDAYNSRIGSMNYPNQKPNFLIKSGLFVY